MKALAVRLTAHLVPFVQPINKTDKMKFKLKSKRLDKIRSIESRITYCRIWYNIVDKVWAVSYYDSNAGDWIENEGYVLDSFETKKEAIEWCKQYGQPIEAETKNGEKITSYL